MQFNIFETRNFFLFSQTELTFRKQRKAKNQPKLIEIKEIGKNAIFKKRSYSKFVKQLEKKIYHHYVEG